MVVKKLFVYSLVFAFISLTSCKVSDDEYSDMLKSNIRYYVDTTNSLSISDIKFPQTGINFERLYSDQINLSYEDHTIWIQLSLSRIPEPSDLYLKVNNPRINNISYYQLSDFSVLKEIHTGELMKFNSRDIKNRHFVFHIEQESSQPDVIFLQIYNDNRPSNLRFELLTEAEFIHKENLKAAFLGIYFGSFAFIMILILFLYIRSRNGVFLVYLIHIFFGNAFFLYYEGLVFKYLLPESGLVSDYLFVLLLAFAILSFQEFGRRLLKLDENLPLLNKTLIGLGIVIFCAIICVFISYETMVFLSLGMTYVAPFSILLLTVGSLQLFLQKPRSDLLIINLALFSWFMAAVVFIGKEFALLPGMFFTEEILKIAFFLEVIFLTLVLLKGVTVNINLKDRRIRYSSNIILSQKASIDEKEQELIKMNKLIDKSFNGMALLNQNMKITWFNKNFRYFHNLEEYTDEEIRSMRLDNIFHYEKVGDTINKCFLTNDNQDIESLVSKDGERYLWVKSTFSPLKDPDETVVLVVDADITELKDTQLELQKHNKGLEESNWFKTEVISNVSHDLASVLNTLTGFINLTKGDGISDNQRNKYFAYIEQNFKDLKNLVETILDYSLLDSQMVHLNHQIFAIDKLFTDIKHKFIYEKHRLNKESFKLKISEFEPLKLKADYKRMFQIIYDLMLAGLNFFLSGEVNIGLRTHTQGVFFNIQIIGEPGNIECRDSLNKVIRGEKPDNAGMNLSLLKLKIVTQLMKKLNGEIRHSDGGNINRSLYQVFIPYGNDFGQSHDSINEDKAYVKMGKCLRGRKVAIIEDNFETRRLIKEILNQEGAETLFLKGKSEILRGVDSKKPDLILFDFHATHLDSAEIIQSIQEKHNVPVILVSSFPRDSISKYFKNIRIDHYLLKPFNKDSLIYSINMVLN